MNIQDPISDLITQIRNGQMSKKEFIVLCGSKQKIEILKILKEEGYIIDFKLIGNNNLFFKIKIILKYYKGKPVIYRIVRVSKPSSRVYNKKKDLPNILNGFGLAIVSTSKGVMTSIKAKKNGCGGEVLCFIE